MGELMEEFSIMDGNGLFDFVSTTKISPEGEKSYEVIKSFIRSAIHTGDIESKTTPEELEKCIVLLNLFNAIRWFQQTYEEVEPWDM
jgi:hypothetical protein